MRCLLALLLLPAVQGLCWIETFAEKATDPITPLFQLQFQNNFSPQNYHSGNPSNLLQVRSLLPITADHFPMDQLIRIQLQVPSLAKSKKTPNGTYFGDTQLFDLFITKEPAWGRWGLGPMMILPTASKSVAGQGKWQLGPAFATSFLKIRNWQLGLLAQNPISVAGDSHKKRQNTLYFQPFLIRHFASNWYLSSDAEWIIDWYHHVQQIPLNIGAGGIFALGKQRFNATGKFQGMVHQNAAHEVGFVPKYSFVFTLSLLFDPPPQKVYPQHTREMYTR
jgi:hypothetical protein